MTGSALSLYLEETKVNEDSMFPSEISPIRKDDVPESKIQNSLNLSARDNPAQGKREPSDGLFPTTLALHKVLQTAVCPHCHYKNYKYQIHGYFFVFIPFSSCKVAFLWSSEVLGVIVNAQLKIPELCTA